MNEMALVAHIESRMGLRPCAYSQSEELVAYYNAIRWHVNNNPDSIFRKSFELSEVSTASEILRWRHALAMSGYTFDVEGVSRRISEINQIEKIFAESYSQYVEKSSPYRIQRATRWIEGTSDDFFADYEIELFINPENFPHLISNLIYTLRDHGAKLVTPGSKEVGRRKDCYTGPGLMNPDAMGRIRVLHFPDKKDADEYMAFYGASLPSDATGLNNALTPDLWINYENKSFDNWMKRHGKHNTGSTTEGKAPQICQLLLLSLCILREPLDIEKLVDWLNAPISPVKGRLAHRLTECIVKTGGYYNDECRQVIADYVHDEFGNDTLDDTKDKHSKKELDDLKGRREVRAEHVAKFLPRSEPSTDNSQSSSKTVNAKDLRMHIYELEAWATERKATIAHFNLSVAQLQQFDSLVELCRTMQMLIDGCGQEEIEWRRVDSWTSSLFNTHHYTQYEARIGCRTVLTSSMDMATFCGATVWMNVENGSTTSLTCSFLSPNEHKALAPHTTLWETEREAKFVLQNITLPLFLSDTTYIVTYDRLYGEPMQPVPLMLQLEQYLKQKGVDIKDLTTEPKLKEEDLEEVVRVNNYDVPQQVKIESASQLQWPSKLSYTALETIIYHPFDYVMERMLNIRPNLPAQINDIRTTKGNVAHAVIESICAPREEEKATSPEVIRERMGMEFATTFAETVNAYGGILNKPSNRLELKLFEEELVKCISILTEIMASNNLIVTACEREVSSNLSLFDEQSDEDDVTGFIDMTLLDTTNDTTVIFDFKWTRSRKSYIETLSENRSIQLALYQQILTNVDHKVVSRKGYFLMPQGKLYSLDDFDGSNCEKIETDSDADVIKQVVNSFHYRKRQIEDGTIELGEGQDIADLEYARDTVDFNLLPLKVTQNEEDGSLLKAMNKYSKYGIFNCRIERNGK